MVSREIAGRHLAPLGGSEAFAKPPGGTLKPSGGGPLGLGLFSAALFTYISPYFEFRVILLTGKDGQT